MTELKSPFSIEAMNKGESGDWCHLCGTRVQYLVQFHSETCEYTRICEHCINLMALDIRKRKEKK